MRQEALGALSHVLNLTTEMEQAAKSLGASELATFRRVIFPNILPGILSGVALAFAKFLHTDEMQKYVALEWGRGPGQKKFADDPSLLHPNLEEEHPHIAVLLEQVQQQVGQQGRAERRSR